MSESTDVELLHRAWKAMSGVGDLSVLEAALDTEEQWLGVEDVAPGTRHEQNLHCCRQTGIWNSNEGLKKGSE